MPTDHPRWIRGNPVSSRIRLSKFLSSAPPVSTRNLIEGVPRTVTIDHSEIRESLNECVATIVNAVRAALERTPPELSADISDRGMHTENSIQRSSTQCNITFRSPR